MMLPSTSTQHYLVELDFNVKFPWLRLLQFLSDLKSTIIKVQLSRSHEITCVLSKGFVILY